MEGDRRRRRPKLAEPLSKRELEVVQLANRGMSYHQVATALSISEATVKRHMANIYAKLEVSSRIEALRYRCVVEGCGREVVVV